MTPLKMMAAGMLAATLSVGAVQTSLAGPFNRADATGLLASTLTEACTTASGKRSGPCQRYGCSGKDQYCKSYVVFEIFGMTLYRHCTGEIKGDKARA